MHPGGRPKKEITLSIDNLPDKEYFTVKEVSELTGIHVNTIWARLNDGTLKGKKLGRSWKIYRESLLTDKVRSNFKAKNQE